MQVLKRSLISTPLGRLVAIGDDDHLHLLEFADSPILDKKVAGLKAKIVLGQSKTTESISRELGSYFKGDSKEFATPLVVTGTSFQKEVWNSLQQIPYNKKICYKEQAESIDRPKSFRAVANANNANRIAIVIPCHRVVEKGGKTGGYASGAKKKEWLLQHENKYN